MAYSKFIDLKKTVQQFELQAESTKLFSSEITTIAPSAWLKETIAISFDIPGVDSEKERSERLVHPILTEVAVINKGEITIYSGHDLNVDKSLGLNGECDYMLSLGRKVIDYIDAPIFSIVEAKKQNFELGISQSVVQLIGAQRLNEKEGKPLSVLFGAATDGVKWRFFKLEGKKLSIDTDYYTLENIPKLLGVLQSIIDTCKVN